MASGRPHPITNYIFAVPRIALRYVCGPNNINITKLPGLCGAHAFIDPSDIMARGRIVHIVLSGPAECQVKALGELSHCLMNFDASHRQRTYRPSPYARDAARRRESPPRQRNNRDGDIVEETIDGDDGNPY